MKAADISDGLLLSAIRRTAGKNNAPNWSSLWDIQEILSEFPPKVVLAKLRSAVKRKLLDGCYCGCRGDFSIVGE